MSATLVGIDNVKRSHPSCTVTVVNQKVKNRTRSGEKNGSPRKHGTRYPWERWFSSGRFTLKKGIDFKGRTDTMAQMVRNAAGPNRHDVSVSIEISEEGDALTVTVLDKR